MAERIIQTIGVFRRGSRVLLGMKLRGFGAGLWNGPGGKFDEGEDKTVEGSFRREALDESGLTVNRTEQSAFIEFRFVDKPGRILETSIFDVLDFSGEPKDTEEMGDWRWFDYAGEEVPYDQMWPADKEWLPLVLAGKKIRGKILYDSKETRRILSSDLQVVAEI